VSAPWDCCRLALSMPETSVLRLAGLLAGEDGLATMRHGHAGEQELWTTRAQADELLIWLASLPAAWEIRILGWLSDEEAMCTAD